MKAVLRIAQREIKILIRNRVLVTFAIIFPVLTFLFFTSLLHEGVPNDLPVAVVDLDNSALSRKLVSDLDATPQLQVSDFPLTQQEGERLIRLGQVYGLISIPDNFDSKIRRGQQVTLLNQYNSNFLLPGGLENKAVRTVIGNLSAGISVKKEMKQGTGYDQAVAGLQPVALSSHIISNPQLNYSYYLNTGFLSFFLQIFVILTTIYSFGSDLKYGKGNKLWAIGNESISKVLAGKVLPYTLWFIFLGIAMLFGMFVLKEFPMNGSKTALLVATILLVLSSQAVAIFLTATSKSIREALTKGSGFAAVGLSFSGITFPIFGMPVLMQWLSQIFPYTHYLKILIDQSQRAAPVYYSLWSMMILLLFCVVPLLLSRGKLKKLLINGEYPETA